MRHFRFSIRGLMLVIVLLGIGFAGATVSHTVLGKCLVFIHPVGTHAGRAGRRLSSGGAASVLGRLCRLRLGIFRAGTRTLVRARGRVSVCDDHDPRSHGASYCAEGLSGSKLCQWVQSSVRSGSTNSLASLELTGISSRQSLAQNWVRDPGEPRTLPADRPRVLLHVNRVCWWWNRSLPGGHQPAINRHGAIMMTRLGLRRFQFSVRSLLLMTAVLALSLAPVVWVTRERRQMLRAREEAIRSVILAERRRAELQVKRPPGEMQRRRLRLES